MTSQPPPPGLDGRRWDQGDFEAREALVLRYPKVVDSGGVTGDGSDSESMVD